MVDSFSKLIIVSILANHVMVLCAAVSDEKLPFPQTVFYGLNIVIASKKLF